MKQRESIRYLENAKKQIKDTPIEGNFYTDRKPVRVAFGTAYLAVLEAINEALSKKGVTKKQFPKSVAGYRQALRKYLSVHNGKLMTEFEGLYDTLHIAGYYRGLLYNATMVKDALNAAKIFINKLR